MAAQTVKQSSFFLYFGFEICAFWGPECAIGRYLGSLGVSWALILKVGGGTPGSVLRAVGAKVGLPGLAPLHFE